MSARLSKDVHGDGLARATEPLSFESPSHRRLALHSKLDEADCIMRVHVESVYVMDACPLATVLRKQGSKADQWQREEGNDGAPQSAPGTNSDKRVAACAPPSGEGGENGGRAVTTR